jgi:cytochrome c
MVRLLNCVRPALSALICGSAALLAAPASAGDVGHGKLVFTQQCAVCHSSSRGGAPLVGPNLYGVVDRRAGAVQGFNYSPALKGSGLTWTSANLNTYLEAPAQMLPGVRMPFAGIKNVAQRDDLVAYLQTLR